LAFGDIGKMLVILSSASAFPVDPYHKLSRARKRREQCCGRAAMGLSAAQRMIPDRLAARRARAEIPSTGCQATGWCCALIHHWSTM